MKEPLWKSGPFIFALALMRLPTTSAAGAGVAPEYSSITSAGKLAGKLTDDLRAVSADKHLRVEYFKEGSPPEPSPNGPTAEQLQAWHASAAVENFGIAKVERMEGNVGYIDLRSIDPAADAAPVCIRMFRLRPIEPPMLPISWL